MPILIVPKVLREKLGEEGADALVELINLANSQTKADVLTFVEEKFERRLSEELGKLNERLTTVEEKFDRRLSEELGKVNERITAEISKLNERLTIEIGKVNVEFAKVRQEMAELKAGLIRWMFIFWVGQLGAILGILFAFFRK